MIVFTEVISSCVLTTVFLAQLPIFILPCSSVMFPYNHISSLPVKTALPNPSGCKAVTGGGFKQLVQCKAGVMAPSVLYLPCLTPGLMHHWQLAVGLNVGTNQVISSKEHPKHAGEDSSFQGPHSLEWQQGHELVCTNLPGDLAGISERFLMYPLKASRLHQAAYLRTRRDLTWHLCKGFPPHWSGVK